MLKGAFTSVLCFIWHKMIHCSVFQPSWFLFTPLCLLCLALKIRQHKSSENNHISRWPDVSWNVFKLLVNESKLACVKISIKSPGVNKERRKKASRQHAKDYSSWFSPKILLALVGLGKDHLFKEVLVHLFGLVLVPPEVHLPHSTCTNQLRQGGQ